MKKIILLSILIIGVKTNYAQFGKDLLKRAKENAKQQANNKADQKINNAIDDGLGKTDAIGKKKKKKEKTGTAAEPATADTPVETTSVTGTGIAIGEGSETVIQTNITCAEGKKKAEALLKKQDGVFEVNVDITNGELSIRYSSDGTAYTTLIEIINKLGFEADGKKATGKNPCK